MTESGTQADRSRDVFMWRLLPFLIGLFIAALIPRPQIGLIRLNDAIYPTSAHDLITQIDYAIDHPEIRAVVLELDSPGGTVVDTEAAYMELARLRKLKPVVTDVDGLAASGAYYLSSGTDYIIAKPASLVGNVGVIGYLPPTPFIFEDTISTGPYKLWGEPRDTDLREIEMIKQGFLQAVLAGRGDRLKLDPQTELLRGQIWSGIEGLRLGIIDALGGQNEAAHKAAQLAHIANYELTDVYSLAGIQSSAAPFFMQSKEGMTLPYPNKPGFYLLYVPPLPVKP